MWAIVNNAGIESLSDIEMAPIECFKSNAEVNLYGMVRVTKAFLPTIRTYKGRIINVTSVKGRIAIPGNATYVMTKYGGEAFSDCLRREVKRFGVKVIIIEPGNFAITALFSGKNLERFQSELNHAWEVASDGTRTTYGRKYLDHVLHSVDADARVKYAYPNLNPVMDVMEDSVTNENPQHRYLIDGCSGLLDKYCVFARLNPYLPERFMDYLIEKYFPSTPIAAETQVTDNQDKSK
ncbi:hypothetical protein CHS0354_028278 [Potamilus streckersoni]|uniref:D-beta-hydroxybutyrate dehydrogenase, mitochondrial n=1 Tax=Potamilus streckersoni TaxID=2493646 RepID=A0AAE0RTY6_9BIVA|nr:hypothetical protein CHS0354_028278 [Potamilus streckersoni]